MAAREDQLAVQQVIASLPRRQRAAVVFRYYQGLGCEEIGEVIGPCKGVGAALGAGAVYRVQASA
ncbi:MAG: RNA polymerase sigma factor [Planctomycetota bacterium]